MKNTVLLFCFYLIIPLSILRAADFDIVRAGNKTCIVYDKKGAAIDSITAHLLAEDIKRVTGYLPSVFSDIKQAKGYAIIMGNIQSKLIQGTLGQQSAMYKKLAGKWECYGLKIINNPSSNIKKALLIAGSDKRGTAYGVFDISERIGVSPWYWWADVHPKQQKELKVRVDEFMSSPPSVKYRGIFLNDEDWGLQPWAAKTFEPETGDIGPKTYAKIFELLLRLKANLIWPAMHPSTKAFYYYPGNKKVAADYSIMVGSSHAEPMLRNNVGEWDERTMGHFNYITNKQRVHKYWEDRVKESSGNDAIYSLGMRGVHDSGIEGVKTAGEAVPLVQGIFEDQRAMLKKYVNKNVAAVPQAFTAYKEVLDIYDAGLKLPEDVTLVWPDDNYGYIQRLNNESEQKRAGGSGIYYHASYWGRPHDYLWLSSTHPALIREEMMKAYTMKADRLWVLNVGDIKPLEYNTQLFLDMAYNASPFKEGDYVKRHMTNWISKIFGKNNATAIQNVLWQYHQLAFERRPEFMGWSQTEPTTKTNYTSYNHFYYGDEAQQRIDKYEVLEKQVKELRKTVPPDDADAFYELVYYPVVGASLINKKFLYRDKTFLYARQNRTSAFDYAMLSKQAYDSIVSETDFYNQSLANGKWKNMMSMTPRDLPVYQAPVLPEISIDSSAVWSIAPEGIADSTRLTSGIKNISLPQFSSIVKSKYFIDLFLTGNRTVTWTSSASGNWITLSQQSGTISPEFGKKEARIWVGIDWNKAPKLDSLAGTVVFTGEGKSYTVKVIAGTVEAGLKTCNCFVENNGYISIHASNFSRQTNSNNSKWEVTEGPGHTRNVIEALPFKFSGNVDTTDAELIKSNAPRVEYDFYCSTSSAAQLNVFTLPTHPLNKSFGMRYAVSVDEAPLQIADFKTIGRSEEWKQNVLRNSAARNFRLPDLQKGKHTLKIYMIDRGVIMDRIIINTGGMQKAYGVVDETRQKQD